MQKYEKVLQRQFDHHILPGKTSQSSSLSSRYLDQQIFPNVLDLLCPLKEIVIISFSAKNRTFIYS